MPNRSIPRGRANAGYTWPFSLRLAFPVLCVAAPALQLLERYGLLHWGVEEDSVLLCLLLGGLVLLITLLIWSFINVRRQKVRAILGVLICAYCLWQAIQNGKIIY